MAGKKDAQPDKKRERKRKADPKAIAALEERMAELEAELEEAKNRSLRTLAEFDNYRKRTRKERDEAAGAGAARVLGDLLDLADNFDRALEHADDGVPESFLEGLRLLARGVHDLLDRNGVARIDSVGAPFDPEVHDALSLVEAADAEANTVLQEVQPGYRMGKRVLRPAKVVVARAPASAPVADGEGKDGAEAESASADQQQPEA